MNRNDKEEFAKNFYKDLIMKELEAASLRNIELALRFLRKLNE